MANPRNRQVSLHLILLIYHLIVTANEVGIPPATVFLIGAQILFFLRIIQAPYNDISQICVNYNSVWNHKEYYRLFFSAFEHVDDIHLYYNMISFVMKGRTLEQMFGSAYYLFIIIVFTILSNITYIFLNYAFSIFFMDKTLLYSCAVGFSGVIFALKVLTTHYWLYGANRTSTNIFRFGVWFELFYIYILSPNTSFLGHLAGILVGFAYTHGPLGPIMESIRDKASILFDNLKPLFNQNNQRNNNQYNQQYFGNNRNEEDENYFNYNYGGFNNYPRYR